MSAFIDGLKARAKNDVKTIVLAEGEELRTIKAAAIVKAEGYAKNILLGNPDKIKKMAADEGVDIDGIEIIDPSEGKSSQSFSQSFVRRRV